MGPKSQNVNTITKSKNSAVLSCLGTPTHVDDDAKKYEPLEFRKSFIKRSRSFPRANYAKCIVSRRQRAVVFPSSWHDLWRVRAVDVSSRPLTFPLLISVVDAVAYGNNIIAITIMLTCRDGSESDKPLAKATR